MSETEEFDADIEDDVVEPSEPPQTSDSAENIEQARRDAINDYFRNFPRPQDSEAEPKTEIPCQEFCEPDGQEDDLFCTYHRMREGNVQNDLLVLQPNSAALFPGNVLIGDDALNGVLTPLSMPLAPMDFSVSLENLENSPRGHMANPSLAEYREARNQILSQGVTGATPAAISFSISQVHSESHMSFMLGVGATWPGIAGVNGNFSWGSEEKKTRVVVNFTQAYYTVDLDYPESPADFFSTDVVAQDIADRVGDGSPPMYIQSITYGRRVIFTIETTESAARIQSALEAAYDGILGPIAGPSVEIGSQNETMLEEASIHAHVIGGSGSDAAGVISGLPGLIEYIRNGANYDRESPGMPIAYKLAYLDNTPAMIALTIEYTERRCVRNRTNMTVSLVGIDYEGGSEWDDIVELCNGWIKIRTPVEDSPVTGCDNSVEEDGGQEIDLWSLSGGSYQSIREGERWTPGSEIYKIIEDVEINQDANLCLRAQFDEADPLFNDSLGYASQMINFDDPGWSGDHSLRLQDEGDLVINIRLRVELH